MSLPAELQVIQEKAQRVASSYGLDFYPVIFEMLDYDQINAVASYGGFPSRYPHWRFGMEYDRMSKTYSYGMSKIYEMVINNDPCYAYLMKSNALVDQKLVIGHVYAHCDFFKNNIWFSKTNRKMINDMANHGIRIRNYIDRLGLERVEGFIDHCLSIEHLIDPHLPFAHDSNVEDEKREEESDDGENSPEEQQVGFKVVRSYLESYVNPKEFIKEEKEKIRKKNQEERKAAPRASNKDILLYLLENAPLSNWQADILSIVRDESYYYAPQIQTKIMNEGWASYWHSTMMTRDLLKDSEIIDFADHHSGTTAMSPGRFNPYKVGLEIFRDVEERWNKGQFGKEYDECDDIVAKQKWDKQLGLGRQKIFEIRKIYNDITFIDEFLTTDLCRRLKLFTYNYNQRASQYEIESREFRQIKDKILFQLTNLGRPFIEVADGNYKNRKELLLRHNHMGIDLDRPYAKETLRSISRIWKRPVNIETQSEGNKKILTYHPTDGYSESE